MKKQLKQFENIPFYSIVVFYGDCELKDISFVPKNTFVVKSERILEVVRKITSENTPAVYSNKRDIVNILNLAVRNGDEKNVPIQHAQNIKEMLGRERVFD